MTEKDRDHTETGKITLFKSNHDEDFTPSLLY